MKITIDYEASWRNSFLDGSNDEALPKKGRNFVSSMTELKKESNFHQRGVTKNTVMGVLSRLIGDQRKLYQAKNSDNYYFADIEDKITFDDIDSKRIETNEMAYIRNMKGSTDQNSFTGMIKSNSKLLNSDFSAELMGILFFDFKTLIDYFSDGNIDLPKNLDLSPLVISDRCQSLKKLSIKKLEEEMLISLNDVTKLTDMLLSENDKLTEYFPKSRTKFSDIEYFNDKQVNIPSIYFSCLYLQGIKIKQNNSSLDFNLPGFSVRNFTKKDFMKVSVTGDKKLIYGNPYVREEFVKGEGKIKHTLTKASGQLEINLDIDFDKAKELKNMIECAGVSSFYLGKKGLAYVSNISAR